MSGKNDLFFRKYDGFFWKTVLLLLILAKSQNAFLKKRQHIWQKTGLDKKNDLFSAYIMAFFGKLYWL